MLNNKHVLIIDDDDDILLAAKLLLKRYGAIVQLCNQPAEVAALMSKQVFDLFLLDMNFSPGDSDGKQGFELLSQIKAQQQDAIVVMITAHGDVDIAVEAIKQGATDFVSKPWQNQKLLATLSTAAQLRSSLVEARKLQKNNNELTSTARDSENLMIGTSPRMEVLQSIIQKSAPTDANILLLGENGTGKSLAAQELHRQSLRTDKVFLAVDLGAVSESLFESELFGHKKGAFTGADKDRSGKLLAANGGTLFLDEIANIPRQLQAKLLTVLEQRQVSPIGSNEVYDLDIRVIAATNIDREQLSNENLFRQDLLFRLNTIEIELPALRERHKDIVLIASHYLNHYLRKYRKSNNTFTSSAEAAMEAHGWPGNIRALRHAIERAVILSDPNKPIDADDLQLIVNQKTEAKNTSNAPTALLELHDLNIDAAEKEIVRTALNLHHYNISKAANALGLTRASLYRRMEKYDF